VAFGLAFRRSRTRNRAWHQRDHVSSGRAAAVSDGDGAPLLDLSREVHEFVELHNPGTEMVKLAGWKLGGPASATTFPMAGSSRRAKFLVVARIRIVWPRWRPMD